MGGNVVLPDPGYPGFGALPEIFDQEPRPYRLIRDDGFRLDPGEVIDLIDDRTRLVVVNTPHNPTGTIVGTTAMRTIQEAAAHRGVAVAIDQVQHPIAHAGTSPPGAEVDGAVLVGDMSKAMSLAGLRLGWVVDADAGRRKRYFDIRRFFTISTSPLSERLSAIGLRQRQRALTRAQSLGSQNLTVLRAFFDRHPDRFDWVEPRAGWSHSLGSSASPQHGRFVRSRRRWESCCRPATASVAPSTSASPLAPTSRRPLRKRSPRSRRSSTELRREPVLAP